MFQVGMHLVIHLSLPSFATSNSKPSLINITLQFLPFKSLVDTKSVEHRNMKIETFPLILLHSLKA